MPMRSKRPWSETLLDSSREASVPTPQRRIEQSRSEPVARRMHDSYTQIDLPFSSTPELLEQYVNAWGGIRTGKLMEHLDSLAGAIAYKHMLGPVERLANEQNLPFYLVTASVDRYALLPLNMRHPLTLPQVGRARRSLSCAGSAPERTDHLRRPVICRGCGAHGGAQPRRL